MEQVKFYSVYRLFDKHNPEITRYVGFTSNLELRFSQHVTGEGINQGKDVWARTPGVEVGIEVIEEGWTTLQEVKTREAYWIGHFLLEGHPLLNLSIPSISRQMCEYDFNEYDHYLLEIPCDSDVYRLLMEDARETGMVKDISRLVTIRIADYYRQMYEADSLA